MAGMEMIPHARSPLSRETRLLLITILASLAALWVLARLRFADRPLAADALTPVLTQLTPPPVFDQLASAVSQAVSRLTPVLMGIQLPPSTASLGRSPNIVSALRVEGDVAVTVTEAPSGGAALASGVTVLVRDPASGLTVLRVPGSDAPAESLAFPPTWLPRRSPSPRYLLAADVSRDGVSLRPIFVGALHDIDDPLWSEPIWALPNTTDLAPNTFVFTPDGEFAGLVVDVDDRLALVPGETVKHEVDRLRREGTRPGAQLGVDVQPLTPGVATGIGAQAGVVVTWVDPRGPGTGHLSVMDVIEALADEPLSTFAAWHARTARLVAEQTISLRVRRHDEVRTVMLTAQAVSAPGPPPLGLTMRSLQTGGVEVLVVAHASAAERAGIQPGDVITVVGDRQAATPAQVRRLFSMATEARPLLIALTRGTAHHVLAVETR
jgi:hypothetical protein